MKYLSASTSLDDDFYSFPVEVIAQWCCVSLRTAAAWKLGVSRMSPQARALFRLHSEGRVLTAAEWPRWMVRGSSIIDPEGVATTQSQLRAYSGVMQFAAHMARAYGERDVLTAVDRFLGAAEASPSIPQPRLVKRK